MPKEPDNLEKILKKITDLDTKMESGFNALAEKINDLQQVATNVSQLQNEVAVLQTNLSVANSTITKLKNEVEDLQRIKASKQIIFENIPHILGEDVAGILRQILSLLNCPPEIFPEIAYRLGKYNPAKPRPPPILAEFRTALTRNSIIAQWKKKKTLITNEVCSINFGLPETELRNIYINKNYSPSIRELLLEARKLKQHGYKIAYEYKNDIYVKRSITDEPIKIRDANFVQELINSSE
jgi:DNA repair exonuclease SbcCD ATPase subunit